MHTPSDMHWPVHEHCAPTAKWPPGRACPRDARGEFRPNEAGAPCVATRLYTALMPRSPPSWAAFDTIAVRVRF